MAAIAMVTFLLIVGVIVGLGSGSSGPPRGLSHGGHPTSPSAATGHRPTSVAANAPTLTDSYVMQMGVIGGGSTGLRVGWAINGLGIYLTTDDGEHWRDITPPLIANQEPGDRVDALTGYGPNDLWLPVVDVIGLVPLSQSVDGSDRGEGVERSTNGGRTWAFSVLPGCLQTCGGFIDLSFVDASHGFAVTGPGGFAVTGPGSSLQLFSTSDGGATWAPVSVLPFSGDTTSIVFTTDADGWAVTGPTFGFYTVNHDRMIDPGGALYRTTDDGVTWQRAGGLPSSDRYQLPTFFSPSTGVVLGQSPGARPPGRATVFVTSDGGATWAAHPAPADPLLGRYTSTDLGVKSPPFSAVSAGRWSLFVGPALYTTSDAGRSWQRIMTQPQWSPGAVLTLHFGSASHAWVEAYVPNCQPVAGVGPCTPVTAPILMSTSDGGRLWRALPYWRPPPNQ